ncbi:hypothetical protein ACETRX_30780 [Labrys portucalensis]|uniref:Uncharacterized protein n=1 Tax=Labrys neptuniae TaxID=376174 RepID=A0ABV6ZPC2_9HYPH
MLVLLDVRWERAREQYTTRVSDGCIAPNCDVHEPAARAGLHSYDQPANKAASIAVARRGIGRRAFGARVQSDVRKLTSRFTGHRVLVRDHGIDRLDRGFAAKRQCPDRTAEVMARRIDIDATGAVDQREADLRFEGNRQVILRQVEVPIR